MRFFEVIIDVLAGEMAEDRSTEVRAAWAMMLAEMRLAYA